MRYFQQSIIAGKKFIIRSIEVQDVDTLVDYWVHGCKDIFEQMGINLNLFPTKLDREKFFRSLIDSNPCKGESHLIVGLADEEIIGYALFNHIQQGKDCQGHLHVIKPHFRRRGITSKLMIDNMKKVVAFLNIKTMYLEPSSANPSINRFLQKHLIYPKKKFLKPAQGICREMEVNQYKLTISFIRTVFLYLKFIDFLKYVFNKSKCVLLTS